jgi:hypothetical protein
VKAAENQWHAHPNDITIDSGGLISIGDAGFVDNTRIEVHAGGTPAVINLINAAGPISIGDVEAQANSTLLVIDDTTQKFTFTGGVVEVPDDAYDSSWNGSVEVPNKNALYDAIEAVRTLPQNSQSAAYTTVAADSGKHLLHPAADTNTRTFTIDSNANVPYPVGTAITFVNETSQVLTIAITSDTLTLAGTTTTGSRQLAQNGIATALKVTTTKWIINGTGLS